jgi:hypothetical protein
MRVYQGTTSVVPPCLAQRMALAAASAGPDQEESGDVFLMYPLSSPSALKSSGAATPRGKLAPPRHKHNEGTFVVRMVSQGLMARLAFAFFLSAAHSMTMAQNPNLEAQRAAMKKLSFLIGEWSGEASVARAPGVMVDLSQTEVAHFKLDGLVLMIEGVGRTKSDGKPALQAIGLIMFDDAAGVYRMRAYNDGRWLEAEVKLLEDGKSLTWGFAVGEIRTKSVLRINEKGEWTELAEITIGGTPSRKLMELVVRRRN